MAWTTISQFYIDNIAVSEGRMSKEHFFAKYGINPSTRSLHKFFGEGGIQPPKKPPHLKQTRLTRTLMEEK